MFIRNSAKAIILKDSEVLLTKNEDDEGFFYLFPGGGQEHGETLPETLIRECLEEIGKQVDVADLLHIREYIGKNHEHAHFDGHVHQVEYYFICHTKTEQDLPLMPTNPDGHQVGIEWIPVRHLMEYRIYPKEIRKYIQEFETGKRNRIYLGDIN